MLQHSRVHHDQRSVREFACQHEGCHYLARSATDARRHLVSHTSERNFACSEPGCDYRGKSLAQLRSALLRFLRSKEEFHVYLSVQLQQPGRTPHQATDAQHIT
uniref:C2H2-type domain-containing protein n=1 Tax=Anopheles merus TaxID=30066 RepID=A0A182VL00_ANOME